MILHSTAQNGKLSEAYWIGVSPLGYTTSITLGLSSLCKMSWFDENQCGTGYKSLAQNLAHSKYSFIHLVFLLELLLCTIKVHSRSWRGKQWTTQTKVHTRLLSALPVHTSLLPADSKKTGVLCFWSETPSLLRVFPRVTPSWWSCLPCVQISSSYFTST